MADKNIMTMNERKQQARERIESGENLKKAKRLNKKKVNKKKRKGIIISSVALLLTATTGLTAFFMTRGNKKNKPEYEPPKNTITNNIDKDEITPGSLDNLGVELDFPKPEEGKKEYANPSSNIDTSKIVEDEKGTTWVSPEAESKKDEVGKKGLDTQGGTLEKKPDGDVYEKEPSYQITDKDGNVKEEGTGKPVEPDKDTGKLLDEEHSNKGLYVAPDGLIYGSEKEYLDSLKEDEITNTETEFIPTAPTTTPETSSKNDTYNESTSKVDEPKTDETLKDDEMSLNGGVLNADGTYTNDGLTFLSKADFEQWVINGGEGYKLENGIIVPILREKENQKVLTK